MEEGRAYLEEEALIDPGEHIDLDAMAGTLIQLSVMEGTPVPVGLAVCTVALILVHMKMESVSEALAKMTEPSGEDGLNDGESGGQAGGGHAEMSEGYDQGAGGEVGQGCNKPCRGTGQERERERERERDQLKCLKREALMVHYYL